MSAGSEDVPGFIVPIHASLGAPILLGGAPRALAITIGTAGAAIGLGLQQWLAGIILWALCHSLAVAAARRDPDFLAVTLRHLRQKAHLSC
ncbi:VirB3 family type IV secretion system protein [Allosphingosinicella indica]|uniref:Type IV secretion system protein VirB3 n=1 Tax=Allosphingosinicella indica TaxID=941907 RepID=A0A1X7FYP4_9SPHN|nr:VirB3 family type IV secretion system protein [Allosphingosinicella indica]SMF61201.1 type IV secretion system protein VirB3 [Allosphingosinicella indica]